MHKIRKLIIEALGIQSNIEKITEEVMSWTYPNLNFNLEMLKRNGYRLPIVTTIQDSNVINDTKISIVKTNIFFKNTNEEKIGGEFIPKNTIRNKNGTFEVEIQLNIHTANDINSDLIKNKIESVISHELNHAFVFIKKYDKKSKSQVYNRVKGMLKMEFNKIPELNEFVEMFYLNLPEEMQARVQETGTLLKRIKVNNSNEAVRELYLYQPINDAKRMIQYSNENLKSLDKNILQNFVNAFNGNVDFQKKENDIKRINNVDKFFKYWIDEINYNGYQLNLKILKLVSDKFNKEDKLKHKENDKAYLNEFLDSGFFDELLGERLL